MPFSSDASMDAVKAAVMQMKKTGILTEEEYARIPMEKICKMLNSSLGVRMREAQTQGKLYKEQQFVIGMPMNEVYADTEESDLELIQGIIDAYFEEEDALVLMDYKTDKVSAEGGEDELIERYHAQLEYYKKTLEQLTGKRVKETYIYSFSLDKVIELML
jgi:ATP-dependent helicase/nuclease subunit A